MPAGSGVYVTAADAARRFAVTGSAGSPVKAKFDALAAQWQKDTMFHSSISAIVLDPSYQKIIGLGVAVVPFILQEMRKAPGHWYWALAAITQENPAEHASPGDIGAICDAWIQWGIRRGLLEGRYGSAIAVVPASFSGAHGR
jgi:hypothetical protein